MKKNPVEKHFDTVAKNYDYGKKKYSYYYENLKKLLGELIPKNKRVFEIGCGTGELLASLKPKYGYGMDISKEMIRIAKHKQFLASQGLGKNLTFSTKWPTGTFDCVFMSDVVEHLENPEKTFSKISKLMAKNTVFINTMANSIWEPLLMFWEQMGWKMQEGIHKRISYSEINKILKKQGLKTANHDYRLLLPIKIPFVTNFVNRYLERYLRNLAFIEYFVATRK